MTITMEAINRELAAMNKAQPRPAKAKRIEEKLRSFLGQKGFARKMAAAVGKRGARRET